MIMTTKNFHPGFLILYYNKFPKVCSHRPQKIIVVNEIYSMLSLVWPRPQFSKIIQDLTKWCPSYQGQHHRGAEGGQKPLKGFKKKEKFVCIKVIKISFSVIFNEEIHALEGFYNEASASTGGLCPLDPLRLLRPLIDDLPWRCPC